MENARDYFEGNSEAIKALLKKNVPGLFIAGSEGSYTCYITSANGEIHGYGKTVLEAFLNLTKKWCRGI